MEKKPPCALDDEDLLDQGRLHPHVRLQEDPLEHLQSENRVNGGHDGGLNGSQVLMVVNFTIVPPVPRP